MIDDRSDKELIAAHVGGDPSAFEVLFTRHKDRMWAVALRTTSDPEEAADGLQDAMISAFRGAGSYRGDAAVTTWLHRVVVNACLDRMRRRRSRPTVPLPGTDPESGHDTLADPHDAISAKELSIELERALADLSQDQRMAIVLVDVQGYRVDEAATILGVPSGTIKSRCARGRAKLALRLAPLRPSGNPDQHADVTPPGPQEDGR
ncbi:MAG: polymerase sigma-70 factor, subfamily [Actinomycetota bacterium]|nr:polymerase sigma-70 factor, subfamily [Actinomycetota bacterium]